MHALCVRDEGPPMSMLDNDKRWEHLYKLTGRSSTMASPNFVPGDMVRKHQGWRPLTFPRQPACVSQTAQLLHEMIRVLVVGAGGLGEFLVLLASAQHR